MNCFYSRFFLARFSWSDQNFAMWYTVSVVQGLELQEMQYAGVKSEIFRGSFLLLAVPSAHIVIFKWKFMKWNPFNQVDKETSTMLCSGEYVEEKSSHRNSTSTSANCCWLAGIPLYPSHCYCLAFTSQGHLRKSDVFSARERADGDLRGFICWSWSKSN